MEASLLAIQTTIQTGGKWFWWVAGLSLVNSVVALSGGQVHFVVGLGVTLIADSIAQEASRQNPDIAGVATAIALVWALLVSAMVFVTGWLVRKRYLAAFVIGMGLYALDGLIFLLFQDWMSVAFHGLALFFMGKGLQACLQWCALEREVLQTA